MARTKQVMKACAVPKDGRGTRVAAPEGAGKEISEKLKHLSANDAQQVTESQTESV